MIKICKLCGEQFETNYKNKSICDRIHLKICPICGKEFEVTRNYPDKKACSKDCMKSLISQKLSSEEVQQKIISTNMKKYGVAHPAQLSEIRCQTKQKNLDKYGAEYPIQLDEMKEKRKQTNLQRYGVEHVSQNPEVQDKIKKTCLERYGVKHPSSSEEIKKKKLVTYRERYGVDNPMQNEKIKAKAKHTVQQRYGVDSNISQNEDIQAMIRQHNLEKYGVAYVFQSEEIKAKTDKTNLERYGTKIPMQSEVVKDKMRKTIVERYGGFTYQSEALMNKVRQTNLERYGEEYASSSQEIKDKVMQTNMLKRGVSSDFQSEEVKQKITDTVQEKYGVAWNCMRPEARNYHTISKVNKEFASILAKFNIEYEFEFPIKNRSYDFILKNRNILIEIDPTITHNSFMSIFDEDSNGLDKSYHLKKSELAATNGYRCIHIFDWEDQKKIAKMLNIHTTLYARKCALMNIDSYTVCQFEEKNHIQGKCNGQKINYGLYHKGGLIQVMTFGKPRYNKKYQYELLRLCTKIGYRVIGGASKMFKHFIDDHHPYSIISYCDRSKFNGEVYEKIGMKHLRDTEPNKIWSKDDKHITNNLLLQRGYDQLFNANYGKGTNNEELMLNDGWLPIYDCGQSVYEWRR